MNIYINKDNETFAHLWALENYKINDINAALQLAAWAAHGPRLQHRFTNWDINQNTHF